MSFLRGVTPGVFDAILVTLRRSRSASFVLHDAASVAVRLLTECSAADRVRFVRPVADEMRRATPGFVSHSNMQHRLMWALEQLEQLDFRVRAAGAASRRARV